MRRRALLVAATLLAPRLAGAQPRPRPVSVGGLVETPASYTIDGLAGLRAVEVDAAREGGAMSKYVGTLVWPLLVAAKLTLGDDRLTRLAHVVLVTGADGYTAYVALGELDPNFEGKPIIVAYKQDGVLLAAPRFVVPGDKHAGRSVRDLVSIEVR